MFTLRTLFVAVAYVALICAALVYRSPFLGNAILTLTLAIALGATIAAWRFPTARGFYGPLALAMWLYMLVLFYGKLEDVERHLVSNQLIFRWLAKTEESRFPFLIPQADHPWATWQHYMNEFRRERPPMNEFHPVMLEFEAFYYTVHCASALLLGLWAGWLTVWVERKAKE